MYGYSGVYFRYNNSTSTPKPARKRDVVAIALLYAFGIAIIAGALFLGSTFQVEPAVAGEEEEDGRTAAWFDERDRYARGVLGAISVGNTPSFTYDAVGAAKYALHLSDQNPEPCVHLFHLSNVVAVHPELSEQDARFYRLNELPLSEDDIAACYALK